MSNRARYDPFWMEIDSVHKRYYRKLRNKDTGLLVKAFKTSDGFIMPVGEEDVVHKINTMPPDFMCGLRGVFLLRGRRKQLTSFRTLFCYGIYWAECIFLFPFPRNRLQMQFDKMKPHYVNEMAMAGAVVEQGEGSLRITFDHQSLRLFYLNDVLIHEIGHHVDRHNTNRKKRERFAQWVVAEHGFKYRP